MGRATGRAMRYEQPNGRSRLAWRGVRLHFRGVRGIVTPARQPAAHSENAIMTAAYWMIRQHIVEFEQSHQDRATWVHSRIVIARLYTLQSAPVNVSLTAGVTKRECARATYGTALIERCARNLKTRLGRGSSRRNLQQTNVFTYRLARFARQCMANRASLRRSRFSRHRLENLEASPHLICRPNRQTDQVPVIRAHRIFPRLAAMLAPTARHRPRCCPPRPATPFRCRARRSPPNTEQPHLMSTCWATETAQTRESMRVVHSVGRLLTTILAAHTESLRGETDAHSSARL